MSNWSVEFGYKGFNVRLQSYGPWGERNRLTWVTDGGTIDGQVWLEYWDKSEDVMAHIVAQVEGCGDE